MSKSFLLEEHALKQQPVEPGKSVIYQSVKVMRQHFSDLYHQLRELPDPRERHQYLIDEIVMGGISMFLFKEGTRNAFNNDRTGPCFRENYQKIFNMRLPHMDTVNDVFRLMDVDCIEAAKSNAVSALLRKKVLAGQRFMGHYLVAIDGTGMASYDHKHCDSCLSKTSKNGKTTYFHHVLEAKLITHSGMSLSIATEWISNQGKADFDKQDCEREAFKRLAKKIKKAYPRLPVIIVADGLYPWEGFFNICQQNSWKYIVTLKDNSLKTLQEDIHWEKRFNPEQKCQVLRVKDKKQVHLGYQWLNGLAYRGHCLNWVECVEETGGKGEAADKLKRFVHLSDLPIDANTCAGVSDSGRLRQKIENEGFNIQKNHGYNLEHKFSRVSFSAMQIYYQCLQIAHMINQLTELTTDIAAILKTNKKFTVRYLWKRMISFVLEAVIEKTEIDNLLKKRFQIRLE
jgi:hypothetical protein